MRQFAHKTIPSPVDKIPGTNFVFDTSKQGGQVTLLKKGQTPNEKRTTHVINLSKKDRF